MPEGDIMKDIEIAKDLLTKEHLALVIVKQGEVIFKSNEKGITPLYTAVNEIKESMNGASVADKAIGKAAAMLCLYAGINELYTKLISEKAIDVLCETEITYQYDNKCSFIKNRNNTGMCPVETLASNTKYIEDLLYEIHEFLKSINTN